MMKQFIDLKYEEKMVENKLVGVLNGMVNSPSIKYNPILIERLRKMMDIKTSDALKLKV